MQSVLDVTHALGETGHRRGGGAGRAACATLQELEMNNIKGYRFAKPMPAAIPPRPRAPHCGPSGRNDKRH